MTLLDQLKKYEMLNSKCVICTYNLLTNMYQKFYLFIYI